jgi:uncharacterized phage protein (TIGR02218 family)
MSYDNNEYSNELGQPVELFLFMNGSVPYAYTSADQEFIFAGNTFTAVDYIECADIADVAEGSGQNSTTIKTHRNLDVCALFLTTPPPNPVWVTVYRYHRGDSEFRRYWGGRVRAVKFDGESAEIIVESEATALERPALWKTFQPACNHILFSLECSLSEDANRRLITVATISGNVITDGAGIIAGLGSGYCTAGQAKRLTGERRAIVAHVGGNITLLQAFEGLAVGEQIYISAGCDGLKSTCASGKFKDGGGNPVDNKDNHGGFDKIPAKNPVKVGLV